MDDNYWMRRALELAEQAKYLQEIPVGAIIICDNQIIAEAFNEKERKTDATAHAEVLAIQRASQRLGRWRLSDCTLYVTLEPCFMCVGAVISSRIGRLVYGTPDSKAGAVESTYKLLETKHFNHYPKVESGPLKEECSQLLKDFFQNLRAMKS